jgi:YegS/Rv2252/BmrU family lipid kinase
LEAEILIIANHFAQGGKAKNILDDYELFLKKNQAPYFTYRTNGTSDTIHIQKLFKVKTFSKLVVIGGDGTINIAINGLPNFDIPVVVIPAGSGNDLAKMIYEKIDLRDIFNRSIISDLTTKKIDVWKCNSRRFINGFGAGFDGAIANKTAANTSTILPSKMKYWIQIIKHIIYYPAQTVRVKDEEYPTFMISVANGRVYGGDFKVAPEAIIDDGLLEVIRYKRVYTPLRMVYLLYILFGKHLNKKYTLYSREKEITISSDKKLPAHLDGEPILESVYAISFDGQINVMLT